MRIVVKIWRIYYPDDVNLIHTIVMGHKCFTRVHNHKFPEKRKLKIVKYLLFKCSPTSAMIEFCEAVSPIRCEGGIFDLVDKYTSSNGEIKARNAGL